MKVVEHVDDWDRGVALGTGAVKTCEMGLGVEELLAAAVLVYIGWGVAAAAAWCPFPFVVTQEGHSFDLRGLSGRKEVRSP